jgi:hypothetical protein
VNFPRRLRLSREEWTRFSNIASLGDSARPELEMILGLGKFMAAGDKESNVPSKIRDLVINMNRNARKLRNDLLEFDINVIRMPIGEAEFHIHLYNESGNIDRIAAIASFLHRRQLVLERQAKNLDPLIGWLDWVESEIRRGKTGNKNTAAYWLGREIDGLLRCHTGAHLTPSVKQSDPGRALLAACLKFLGMKIKPQTLIRRVAAERHGKVTSENS